MCLQLLQGALAEAAAQRFASLLDTAWTRVDATAQGGQTEPLALVTIDRNSPGEIDTVMERLLGRGTSQEVLSVGALPSLS